VLEKEIQLYRKVNVLKEELKMRWDYSTEETFSKIDFDKK
jgi:hypothetical protein